MHATRKRRNLRLVFLCASCYTVEYWKHIANTLWYKQYGAAYENSIEYRLYQKARSKQRM